MRKDNPEQACVWCRAFPLLLFVSHSLILILLDHILVVPSNHADLEQLHVVLDGVYLSVVHTTLWLKKLVIDQLDSYRVFNEMFTLEQIRGLGSSVYDTVVVRH
jgi:hypothetical protein